VPHAAATTEVRLVVLSGDRGNECGTRPRNCWKTRMRPTSLPPKRYAAWHVSRKRRKKWQQVRSWSDLHGCSVVDDHPVNYLAADIVMLPRRRDLPQAADGTEPA
jgi:hypothetical protein